MISAIESFILFLSSFPGILGFVLFIYLVMSFVAFIAYGVDKRRAVKGKFRTPEACLIALAALGGAYGALIGMYTFRHKTKKAKFFITVPVLAVLLTAAAVLSIFA